MELDEMLSKYADQFGDGFPMYQLGRGLSDGEIIKIIQECIDSGKDVYERGLVDDDEDIEY